MEKPSVGVLYIRNATKDLLLQMIDHGLSQEKCENLTTESLQRFREKRNVDLTQLMHQNGRSWGPVVVDRVHELK